MLLDFINIMSGTTTMNRKRYSATRLLLFITLSLLQTGSYAKDPDKLELRKAYWINADFPLNPSGLAYCNGALLTVSDKQDQIVYRLLPQPDGTSNLAIHVDLGTIPERELPSVPWLVAAKRFIGLLLAQNRYDWEDIACHDGSLYLLSETAIDILQRDSHGTLSWMNLDLYKPGRDAGFFQQNNAFAEGMTILGSDSLLVAAERQNRGLLTAIRSGNGWDIKATAIGDSPILPTGSRSPDLTGLTTYQGRLFSLERNASAVCERSLSTLDAIKCWSYAHVENAQEYQYLDHQYGLAEGLALSENAMYIALDNNNDGRAANPNDKRALLL
jgi:hypothetical protein